MLTRRFSRRLAKLCFKFERLKIPQLRFYFRLSEDTKISTLSAATIILIV